MPTRNLKNCYIGYFEKAKLGLLFGAISFDVEHFVANDIIGFYVRADEPEKFNSFDSRLKASYATLPENPSLLNKGKLKF